MKLKKLPYDLTVCKVAAITDINTKSDFFFIGRTDDEVSLVCRAEETPQNTVDRDDGWRGFRIEGTLDFSLIGVLSKISTLLAESSISIFAVSTYNTDFILVKKENYDRAMDVLAAARATILSSLTVMTNALERNSCLLITG